LLFFISERAICPNIIASIEPIPYNHSKLNTKLVIAFPDVLVTIIFVVAGVDSLLLVCL
jgi:hypothetical protein